jgi:hypothetical protein
VTIAELLDELDELVKNAKPASFGSVWVSRDDVYRILDQIRLTLPFAVRAGDPHLEMPPLSDA